MSKCEINIDFDRPDRTYLGGETVSGAVRVRILEDLNCNGIKLTHYWKTHGRGNTDSGERHEQVLCEGRQLLRGENLTFPFSFSAERGPATYHGHYINIDHYVRVDVDVPWAFDPKAEEEYLVRPGKPPADLPGGKHGFGHGKSPGSFAGKVLVFLVVAALLVVVAAFMIVLLPILLIVGLVAWGIKRMVAGRVGKVELTAPVEIVSPGDSWPVEIRFTPRKDGPINGVTVKITAQEAATSGSGTNKTTHRHTLFEEVHTLHPAGTLLRGKAVYQRADIQLPATDAFSFDASDNKIEWSAEVRIDIPRFPDWSQKQKLQMVPQEFLPAATKAKTAAMRP